MAATGFDVVIVGAGSCGSVLAARLSEDPGCVVLLLERGGPARARGPARVLPIGPDSPVVRRYRADVGPAFHDIPGTRAFDDTIDWRPALGALVRGEGIGGSGAVNGAYFVRARPEDFDGWPVGWSYAETVPYFRRSEHDADLSAAAIHGDAGPIPVRRREEGLWHPVTARFVEAARAGGFAEEPDKNAPGPGGVGPVPVNIDAEGLRADPASCYLTPEVLARPNLTVRTGTAVRRVLVRGGRAVGVQADLLPDAHLQPGPAVSIGASTVVLAAGAIETPALLWRSGLADPHRPLEFSDHPEVTIPFTPSAEVARALQDPGAAPLLEATLNIDGGTAGGGSGMGDPGTGTGAGPAFASGIEIRPYTADFAAIGVALMNPRGRGVMRCGGHADAGSAPVIEQRPLANPSDRRDMLAAVEAATTLIAASGIGKPGRPQLGMSQHLSGTCPLGVDPATSTVDPQLRFHGIDGLRISDTSSFPSVPSRGPHATAVMLAESAAALIRGTR